jgi:hypothetical protein
VFRRLGTCGETRISRRRCVLCASSCSWF